MHTYIAPGDSITLVLKYQKLFNLSIPEVLYRQIVSPVGYCELTVQISLRRTERRPRLVEDKILNPAKGFFRK